MSESSSEKFIPMGDTVMMAAKSLPPAHSFRADVFHVPVADSRLIEFRKIKFRNRKGEKVLRWVYEGKIMFT
jgi:hypothetical protein